MAIQFFTKKKCHWRSLRLWFPWAQAMLDVAAVNVSHETVIFPGETDTCDWLGSHVGMGQN